MRRVGPWVCVLAVVSAVLTGVPTSASATPPDDAPLRVLVVGDSVTQGSAGDWTWRYRLWRHLTADGSAVDLVGPRADLYDNVGDRQGSTAYADPAFDRDHASRWGLTLAFLGEDFAIDDLVETYRPDVVVEMLGVNDLTFLRHSPARVSADLGSFVAEARSADPGVDVVLGRLTQTWYDGVPELNERIDGLAAGLDTETSRVAVATPDVGFERGTHTWDPAHPNARGEVVIAAAFADALASLGDTTPAPRPLTLPAPGPGPPVALQAVAGNGTARLSWARVPGATDDEVAVRDVSAGGPWVVQPATAPDRATVRDLRGLVNGHSYAARVRSAKGWSWGDWSPETRFRPLPPLPGVVRVTGAASPRRDVVRVVGGPVSGASWYRLHLARVGSCSAASAAGARYVAQGADLRRPDATVRTPAAVVRVRWVAVNVAGRGPLGPSRCLRVR